METLSRRNFITTAGTLAGSAFLAATAPQAAAQTIKVNRSVKGIEGQKAPELDLNYWIDANGQASTFSVKESKGKWVLLKFFQNWCPGCHELGFPALKMFSDEFRNHPQVAIAAVQTVFEGYNSNTVEDVRKLQLRYELPIPMGHDEGNPIQHELPGTMKNYRTGGTPWMVLVDPSGMVVFNDFHVNPELLVKYIKANVA